MVGQNNRRMTDLGFAPPTVNAHSSRDDGLVLHTIDADAETDIRMYGDGRPMHTLGNPPEA